MLASTWLSVFLVGSTILNPAQIERLSHQYVPNYAAKLSTPFDGSTFPPMLIARWSSMPLRVAVIPPNDSLTQAVRSACTAWQTATDGEVSFTVCEQAERGNAQIVVRGFGYNTLAYRAMSNANETWVGINAEMVGADGKPVPMRLLSRILAHEIGHALGIVGHSSDARDCMSICETATEVTAADANTLRIAYGGSVGSSSGSHDRSVTLKSSGTSHMVRGTKR